MKQTLILALFIGSTLCSCSKKNNPTPAPSNVIEYDFSASTTGNYVVVYYNPTDQGSAQNVTASSWSYKVTIPDTTKTAAIFFTAGENPPFQSNNTGTVTIKLNGKIVATGSKLFTTTETLAEADYTFKSN
ncbi:MAG TPA: hypothetical protein VG367_19480 [Mucilaginibacter sp.]|jgi:hypothetical protein|nr:hypothetical protein [Mucilaginibacter sp.]